MAMLKFERILCPLDFSEYSARAYDYGYSLARHYEARLYLEHVIPALPLLYPEYASPDVVNEIQHDLAANAQRQLEKMASCHPPLAVPVELIVQEGNPADSILTSAEAEAADLIVMGTHGRQGIDRLMMGSVTTKVLHRARCPVLVVRRPAHDFVDPGAKGNSMRLHKVLFCTDFSKTAQGALPYAISLVQEYGAELTLLYTLDHFPQSGWQNSLIEARQRLESVVPAASLKSDKVKSTARIGKPYQEIIQIALEDRTDLIVMGVHGHGAVDGVIFGSTTNRVIQLGPCPVLVVRS